jgi:Zn-finger nucleic acid-binding protein
MELLEQEKIALRLRKQRQNEDIDHCPRILKVLVDRPEFWKRNEFRQIHECNSFFKASPQAFPSLVEKCKKQ